jgi:23S rRNA pseudouridine955/2504/2580 synthase
MSGVATVRVGNDEAGVRLDRWFRRHHPGLPHGLLEKWLRTGQVRIDGRRARAGDRLEPGQLVRIPPSDQPPQTRRRFERPPTVTDAERKMLARRVLHADDRVLILDKPAGLAVQGGSSTERHLDGMLDTLAAGGERPRLVHRLDKETSGVLVLARTAAAATGLARAFRTRAVRKLYWAVVIGAPPSEQGEIDAPLAKRGGAGGERVVVDPDHGRPAFTRYRVVERAGRRAAWLELEPATGRTHQVRAHCAALGTPILGDGKYGGRGAFLAEAGIGRQVHLHARAIAFPDPGRGVVTAAAPLPPHMRETWAFFGFAAESPEQTLRRWPGDDETAEPPADGRARRRKTRRPPA